MYRAGKLDVVKMEMDHLQVHVLGTCDLKRTGLGQFQSVENTIYSSGNGQYRRNGVAFIVWKEIGKSVTGYSAVN